MSFAPPVFNPQRQKDDSHLNTLSIMHYVLGGLNIFGGLMTIVQFSFMGPFMEQFFAAMEKDAAAHGRNGQGVPPAFHSFMHGFMTFFMVLSIVWACVGVLNLFSGYFLRRRSHRTFSQIVAALDCLQLPLGTILGIFTLLVLGRPSVNELYQSQTTKPSNPYAGDQFR